MLNKQDLIDFETSIADLFNSAKIRSPVHLYCGNEDPMIEIFKKVKENDWVFCSWRSHYQCLLKGVDKQRLTEDIVKGKSIALCYPEYRIFSSAIVAGSIPIALGTALSNKLENNNDHVWCFLGDMTSETGTFFECWKYAKNHELPITFVIEDNNKSVCTDTRKTWNCTKLFFEENASNIIYYKYDSKYPHAGAGQRIQF